MNKNIFELIGDAYLDLIHLKEPESDNLKKVINQSPCSTIEIKELLLGESWRERLVGLVLACKIGPTDFFDTIIKSFIDHRGYTLVPITAVLHICINKYGCNSNQILNITIKPTGFADEVSFCLNKLKGIATVDNFGPNDGQDFSKHLSFYTKLCGL